MTQLQRTWNVGETVADEDYVHMPAGVFVADGRGGWKVSFGGGVYGVSGNDEYRFPLANLWEPRVIIPRPANAPAHIPVYTAPAQKFVPALGASPMTRDDFAACPVGTDVQEQIRMLDKIKAEAEALIAERDALKHDLRKAREACKKLREERDAARKMALPVKATIRLTQDGTRTWVENVPATNSNVIHKGQKIDTPAQYDALPPGSRVRKADGQYWQKGYMLSPDAEAKWCASNSDDTMRDKAFPRTVLRIGYDDMHTECAVPTAPRFKVGQIISTREEYEALPVGTKLWPAIKGGGLWERCATGYMHSETMVFTTVSRAIRSLP